MGQTVSSAFEEAADAAQRLVHAIAWREHTTLWRLLSDKGRSIALSVAVRNGLDRVVAGRIGNDLADPAEHEEFLERLVTGLRRDLRSVDIAALTAGECVRVDDHTVAVELETPSLLPGIAAWPAGWLIMSRDDERGWVVDRLEPMLAGP